LILEGGEEMEDKYWSLLLWLFPFITLYYGTRKKPFINTIMTQNLRLSEE